MPSDDRDPAEYVDKTLERLATKSFRDFLGVVRIRDLATGAAHARFTRALPEGHDSLADALRAALPARGSGPLLGDAIALMRAARTDPPEVLPLRRALIDEFRNQDEDDGRRALTTLRWLVAAGGEAADRRAGKAFYERQDDDLATLLASLLDRFERRPLTRLDEDWKRVAAVVTALVDGALLRARADERGAARLLRDAILPVLDALTVPSALAPAREQEEEQLLAARPPASATARYPRATHAASPMSGERLLRYAGTWRGTMWPASTVAKDRDHGRRGGPRETYLVIDPDGPVITNHIETGWARMVTPQVLDDAGRLRLQCSYDAVVDPEAPPERPSHRGGWVLDQPYAGAELLTAAYFNDLGLRGDFIFSSRSAEAAPTFEQARALWADAWEPEALP